ncbi:TPA: group II intron reverse transcriptase/maturase, partial [Streptococcus pneumoniae]|nr:group II intron reverse transcriptase/maturase [Streptococcus pneumoniae]HEW2830567.1 group II intron reverse transcriptase/maturase [Streptococcus pneumoniae]
MRQIWTLGIRDKQLLVIIRKMLKAPIVLPNGKVTYPTKGTPQGGILSPLLANINLNEFDWWIGRQWEERDCKELVPQYNSKGTRHKSHVYRKLRTSTTLKEVYIVRYADDFKIFCRNRNEAERTFKAVKLWLKERLNLPISEEKSQITNLRKKSSEFLGITLKLVSKNNRLVCFSHIASKAKKRIKHQLKQQMKLIQIKGAKETIIR